MKVKKHGVYGGHKFNCSFLVVGKKYECDCGADGMNIPTPYSDLLNTISHKLSKLSLRENGLLDLEVSGKYKTNTGNGREFWYRVNRVLQRMKNNTMALHNILKTEAEE